MQHHSAHNPAAASGTALRTEARPLRYELSGGDGYGVVERNGPTARRTTHDKGPERAQYTIGVTGCGNRETLQVICAQGGTAASRPNSVNLTSRESPCKSRALRRSISSGSDVGADAIEAIAVVLIVGYILAATLKWLLSSLRRRGFTLEHYTGFRASLGRAMLLGLEILIAADVVRTAALDPTLMNIAALGVLVIVRTFLSSSIVLEIEGRWPWQRRTRKASETIV